MAASAETGEKLFDGTQALVDRVLDDGRFSLESIRWLGGFSLRRVVGDRLRTLDCTPVFSDQGKLVRAGLRLAVRNQGTVGDDGKPGQLDVVVHSEGRTNVPTASGVGAVEEAEMLLPGLAEELPQFDVPAMTPTVNVVYGPPQAS